MGDFNQTLSPAEHSSGGTRIRKGMEEFRECLHYASLRDLTIRGNKFTWWNNQDQNPIAKKLDRVLINDEWLDKFSISYAHFAEPDFSDHSLAIIYFGQRQRGRRHFMINHYLLHHEDFIPRLLSFWHTLQIQGSAKYSLAKKLKALKGELRDLNREHFSDLENRTREAQEALTHCQVLLLHNPLLIAAAQEKQAYKKWLTLTTAEEKFLFQRARIKWFECGDLNTAYFHRMVATRRASNQIHYLVNEQGQRLHKPEDIKLHCVSYFEDLLGGQPQALTSTDLDQIREYTTYRLSANLAEALVEAVSAEEIKNVAFSMPTNKTPGPDGFTGEFYRAAWDILGNDIIEAVQEFFRSGKLLKQLNATALSLIPKGFGRSNISPRALLKVDLRKAFDCVKWEYVLKILEAAEFPAVFLKWVEQCITTTSFSININGELCGHFRGGQRLRQGDPLSPALFVIAMELLSNMLSNKFASGQIGYHPLGINPVVSHLAFADDLMIFFNGSADSLQEIASLLEKFKLLSGLSMNRDKSTLFVAGVPENLRAQMQQQGFSIGSFPVRYLGMPLRHHKPRKNDYSPLLDNIRARFNSWASKALSFAGRLQLIIAGCLRAIESMCNAYLWSGDVQKRTSAKVAWKTVAWMKAHMVKSSNFWTTEIGQGASWMWKNLISLKPQVKALLGCKVRDGATVSYWFDNWSQLGPLIDFVGEDGPRLMGIPRDATVAQGTSSFGWRLPSSRTRHHLLQTVRNVLVSMDPPSAASGQDLYTWGPVESRKDSFSTKITWEALRPSALTKVWYKAVWFKRGIPKHSFTFWVANMNMLPVKVRMTSWGTNIDPVCTLCSNGVETRDHLFLHCSYSLQIWHLVLPRLGLPQLMFVDWQTMIHWLLGHSKALPSTLKKLVTQATVYLIWKERNSRCHRGPLTSPAVLFRVLDRTTRDILLAHQHSKQCKGLLSKWLSHVLL
ncbi:PREDICTED: uncharacterized protein LOC104715533 [Camelina sativa]|uniref:Uncharacterized protein LOC104715533 n=1 Tax=Camelina sativa TaxID=90675 RepID=A0ABM0TTP3_CAMSA|nr:PREDICTED: uncharacterized protein LOC104715533 [Camelina sativa]